MAALPADALDQVTFSSWFRAGFGRLLCTSESAVCIEQSSLGTITISCWSQLRFSCDGRLTLFQIESYPATRSPRFPSLNNAMIGPPGGRLAPHYLEFESTELDLRSNVHSDVTLFR